MHLSLLHALDHHVRERGAKVFTRHLSAEGVQELTFADFQQRAAQFARFYEAHECGAGDVVLIFLATSPDVLASFVGAMMTGAIPALMPLPSAKQHPAIYWESHQNLLRRIKPKLILTDRDSAKEMADNNLHRGRRKIVAVEDVSTDPVAVPATTATADAVALLQHSSGTTSLKKGVMLSHGAILRQVESYAASLGATADDGIASWLPVYHDMGLIACSMTPLVLGQTITILNPFAWVARPASLLDAVQKYESRFVWMPNFAFEHMARTVPDSWAGDLSDVKAFINCSEPCKPDTFDRFRARFAGNGLADGALQVCYAMAETVFAVSQTRVGTAPRVLEIDRVRLRDDRVAADPATPEQALRVLSNGPVLSGLDVSIRDPETRAVLAERAVGEIAIEGAFLFDGYYNAPEITAERLDGKTYYTRDLGFLADGELYVLGRKDDLIIVNGRNLHAHEVEALAADVPGLKAGRAVAFGVFSQANSSEELVIVAERGSADANAAEIARLLRERVFDETNIDVKDVLVVDADWLVKTTSGKISREKNRDKYLAAREGGDVASVTPVESTPVADAFPAIAGVIARLFRYPLGKITRATVASDVSGWDSLAHSTLILEVEKSLAIAFADDEMFSFPDVGALVDRATELQGTGQVADRMLLDDEDISIVRFGEAGNGPDLIIFAGAAEKFGGQTMMDFASTLNGTSAQGLRKFFVTDKKKRWFTEAFDRIASTINAASPGEKIVIGNSMGGYGALALSPLLQNIISILSFVPQPSPPLHVAEQIGRTGEEWFVRPTDGVPTCIIFGEIEDERGKAWVETAFATADKAKVLTLPNCGHNVVRALSKRDLLAEVLLCSTTPDEMVDKISELVAKIEPSAKDLSRYVLALAIKKGVRALPHLNKRLAEERLPLVAERDLGKSRRTKTDEEDEDEAKPRRRGERRSDRDVRGERRGGRGSAPQAPAERAAKPARKRRGAAEVRPRGKGVRRRAEADGDRAVRRGETRNARERGSPATNKPRRERAIAERRARRRLDAIAARRAAAGASGARRREKDAEPARFAKPNAEGKRAQRDGDARPARGPRGHDARPARTGGARRNGRGTAARRRRRPPEE